MSRGRARCATTTTSESILIEVGVALKRGDARAFAMRDREFCEDIAEQSGTSALIEALARVALQIQLCGRIASVRPLCRARRARMRRHHTGVRGPRFTARRFSRPRPHQPYAESDSCALCRSGSVLPRAGITSRVSESCYRVALINPGSGNTTER
jgi:hypothetical protein